MSQAENFKTTFVRKTPKVTFFSFFLEPDRIFFQKKPLRQVTKLEWPKAKKKILFVSCNGRGKIRVGRSVKIFFCITFLVKNVCFMHVLR